MFTSYVQNGAGVGEVGEVFGDLRFDPGMLRPAFDSKGRRVVELMTNESKWDAGLKSNVPVKKWFDVNALAARGVNSPVFNATSLRKEDWIHIDSAVVRATRLRLRAWADLVAASSYGGFNAMSKMTHEYEAMTDPGVAVVDMDALSEARQDSPLFKLRSIPLPITHSDFYFSERRLAQSRNSNTPLDTTMFEAAGRRVAEMIEQKLIGVTAGITYGTQPSGNYAATDGTSTEYGYTNYTYRLTKTDLNTPTGSNPEAVKQDVIEMRQQLYDYGYFGPFMLYHSTAYDQFLDDDYFRSGATTMSAAPTLRDRIKAIDGVMDVRRLDYLTSGYQMIMVQMTSDVAQAINGMDITTVQWESRGGMRKNFMVMAIQVALLKAQYRGITGIVHATTS